MHVTLTHNADVARLRTLVSTPGQNRHLPGVEFVIYLWLSYGLARDTEAGVLAEQG